ncbi:hypothetical protein B9Z55_015964 [Caenorhabditis nigoni]|uniref:GTF3C1 extended winged-helix domain-containing protein n=1 Tax=Caenorhabditis nigoni TaxID=1611254 RepID=A0A2G5UD59_9PELO|nr:hypothetical protein B9Z55_015964 [Caenorhabditis nigoni]
MEDSSHSESEPTRALKRKRKESSEFEISHEEESSADEHVIPEENLPSTSELQEEVEELTPKRNKKLNVNTFGPYHFKKDNTSAYMPFVPNRWSPQTTYRLPSDIVLNTIRECGTEGLGRAEIAQVLGYDGTSKSGGRKVTGYITNCTNEHPDHIGQFQKMNGKVRTIRYFWKESENPERFEKLFSEFQELTDMPCPFKIGEVLKFPEKNLNTLRISDITLKRFNRLLRMVKDSRVVVTMNRVIKFISELETADGYKFQIDKKSVLKCLLALQNKGLIQVFDTMVRSDSVNYQVQIITHRDIQESSDPEVTKAIQEILDCYQREGRVFPHGQLRSLKKRPEETHETEFDGKVEEINEEITDNSTINDRYHWFRLQTVRNSWKGRKEEAEHQDIEEYEADETLNDTMEDTVVEEVAEDQLDPLKAMAKLFAKNPEVPVQNKKSSQYYFGKDTLGYQGKTIRLLILHEMAWQFVHGHPEGVTPTCFDLFPPTQAFDKWKPGSEYTAHIYYQEESPYRFMPPQPKYDGVDCGWFMIQDFLAAMPLSVFVLTSYVPTTIDRAFLMTYLTDPVKRHMCIGYLPKEIREIIMKEKKVYKQLQHAFFVLGAMQLMAVGKNPSVRRFPGAASDMFYVAKKAHLYDTSTTLRSYATISPPLDTGVYPRYDYNFESRSDVILYWHHLRAIVQSSALGYRNDGNGIEHKLDSRHKCYSIGVFDRTLVETEKLPGIEELPCHPNIQNDGVAGFDSALFIHLKRHWDLCTVPHATVNWFITKFKKCSEEMKKIIETRVKSVHKDWNNFTRLSISDSDFLRTSNVLKVECPPKMIKKFGGASSKPKTPRARPLKPKKRKLDSVDLVSSSARISVRCRFTPKERDQLIMIRAVGFFLNPVYRFWLDPTVLRDLMHEFVPESRNKTVQSLMACGVRELVRANRLAYLQRVVRNLSTFPEMRRLRAELCSAPISPSQSKTEFFKSAFRTAMRLLFVDNNRIPSTSISDESFQSFLKEGNVSVTKEITVSNACPRRSQKPIGYGHIQHCVAANVLISILIHTKNGVVPEQMLEQVPPAVLQGVLQALRCDGLVSRSRTLEAIAELANKKDATLSYYFRHFFAHRFHSELIDNSGRLLEEIQDPTSPDVFELAGDGPEVVVAASNAFPGEKYQIEMNVDNDILAAFTKIENDQTVKKIRYLESADLHFEKVRVNMDRTGSGASDEEKIVPIQRKIQKVTRYMDNSREVKDPVSLDDFIQAKNFDLDRRREIRAVVHVIKGSRQAGITLQELSLKVKRSIETIQEILADLNEGRQIRLVGVDDHRWVSIEYEACWTVQLGNRRWCPRPWVSPEGSVSLPVVRWIAESVLLLIVGKFGIQMKDVLSTYEFAVQPIAIREIIGLLEHLKCVQIIKKAFPSTKMSSPFSESPETTEIVTYINPTVDGLEKFSKIFHHIDLMPMMTAKSN